MLLKQSTARDAMVLMIDSTDHVTGKTGLTLTITASKAGGAFGSISPTVTERSAGWYSLALTTSHTDTLGDFALHVTGTGADPTDVLHEVVADLPGASVSSVTGNVAGSVASVTGAVGSVTGAVGSVTGAVGIKKNTALAAFPFIMRDSSGAPTTGLTVTPTRSLDGAAFAACANAVTEVANGWYKISLANTDLNGNTVALRFAATGAVDTDITIATQA